MFRWLHSKKTSKKRILIVDDEPNIVRTVADRLKMSGYDVIVAADGQEGMECAVREQPDLILLDVFMPKLDGHAALERLRQMEETKTVPVIMLTARSQVEDVARASALGVVDYVVKPFDLVELLEKIKSALLLKKDR